MAGRRSGWGVRPSPPCQPPLPSHPPCCYPPSIPLHRPRHHDTLLQRQVHGQLAKTHDSMRRNSLTAPWMRWWGATADPGMGWWVGREPQSARSRSSRRVGLAGGRSSCLDGLMERRISSSYRRGRQAALSHWVAPPMAQRSMYASRHLLLELISKHSLSREVHWPTWGQVRKQILVITPSYLPDHL